MIYRLGHLPNPSQLSSFCFYYFPTPAFAQVTWGHSLFPGMIQIFVLCVFVYVYHIYHLRIFKIYRIICFFLKVFFLAFDSSTTDCLSILCYSIVYIFWMLLIRSHITVMDGVIFSPPVDWEDWDSCFISMLLTPCTEFALQSHSIYFIKLKFKKETCVLLFK